MENIEPFYLPVRDDWTCTPGTQFYRTHRPTHIAETEKRLAALYGAWEVHLCPTGMAAFGTLLDLMKPRTIIPIGINFFEIEQWIAYKEVPCFPVKIGDASALKEALKSAEPPVMVLVTNPTLYGDWHPLSDYAAITHKHKDAWLVVDSTHASLYYTNPLADGADACIESYGKYLCGHGDAMVGGLVMASSMKAWEEMENAPILFRRQGISSVSSLRGDFVSADAAYKIDRGLMTLPLRMTRHTYNAQMVHNVLEEEHVPHCWGGKAGLITVLDVSELFSLFLRRFLVYGAYGVAFSTYGYFEDYHTHKPCTRLALGCEQDTDSLVEDVLQAYEKTKAYTPIMNQLEKVEERQHRPYPRLFRDYLTNGQEVRMDEMDESVREKFRAAYKTYFDALLENLNAPEAVPAPFEE